MMIDLDIAQYQQSRRIRGVDFVSTRMKTHIIHPNGLLLVFFACGCTLLRVR